MIRAFVALLLLAIPPAARADEASWTALKQGGHVLLMRHALAPGVSDPAGFRIDDCATQRNLSDEGRRQASRFGAELRRHGVSVDRVLTSGWCRARDTAAAMDVGEGDIEPALNSFFGRREAGAAQTAVLRTLVNNWRGPGTLVLVTHQVNITALTGVHPGSGEAVVLKPARDGFEIVGRIGTGSG